MPDPTAFRPGRFLGPRHWPTWLGLALLRIAVLLPYPWLVVLGRGLGRGLYHLVPARRRIAATNIRLCFPELDAAARRRLVMANFEASATSAFEGALSWWGSEERLRRLYRIEGLQHLERAFAEGKGVILLGAHYTTLEISGHFLAFHIRDRLQPIYKPASNPLFEAVMAGSRRRLFDALLHNGDMRTIVRNVKAGKVVWYAPDQDFGRKRSVFAPFMGVPAATLTTTAGLARLTGAPVIPLFSTRLPGGAGFLLELQPPLEGFPSGDEVADATRVNALIEAQVRRAPEQYIWMHRRFKTRPTGEPKVYR
jgi:KDO2-lipid IV(A) lauroyltransferase